MIRDDVIVFVVLNTVRRIEIWNMGYANARWFNRRAFFCIGNVF